MRIECITNIDAAWQIATPWRELVPNEPLLSPEWLLTWWKHFGCSQPLRIYHCIDESGKTVGIAPFGIQNQYGHQSMQLLGSGHVCTDYSRFITAPDCSLAVHVALADHIHGVLLENPSHQSSELLIDAVIRDDESSDMIKDAFETFGFQVVLSAIENSFQLRLPSTWPEYLQSLGSSTKRKAKKLISRIDSKECRFYQCTDPKNVSTSLDTLKRLHQSRRQTLGQSGSYSDPRFEPFLREAVNLLAQRQGVRVQWCEVNGKAVAMHLLLQGTDTLYMYQSGIEPSLMELEPGHSLTIAAIRQAIEEQFSVYDFLRGDEKYKSYWGGKAIPLSTMRLRPPQTMSRVVGFTQDILGEFKRKTKTVLGLVRSLQPALETK
jgi:CelD/BcsL family acetyltransferase involved in cellulose biosynthesis